jgi:pimeloyl-ACP methyl ester carboxylesterase
MRRWLATPVVLAAALGLSLPDSPRALAQKDKNKDGDGPTAESFYTADGVELRGLFHPTRDAKNPKDAPVVVFLYPPGADRDMTKGDWGGLAKALNKEGYHVFQFDWRGHGKSTNVKDTQKFWTNVFLNGGATNFNRDIVGGPPRMPLKNSLSYKDLRNPAKYMPAYLEDLAAVRLLLDIKNDKGDLNTSSIFVVGSGDAAALGMAWATAEWHRPADVPNVNQLGGAASYDYIPQPLFGGIKNEAGNDFAAMVWLTPSRPASVPAARVQQWVSKLAPKLRENNPMLFLYAEKDQKGKSDANFYYDQVLVAEPRRGLPLNKLTQTFLRPVKGAAQLKGDKLLGQNNTLKTEDTIVEYLAAIKKQRQNLPWKSRDFKDPYFIDVGPNFLGLRY